LNFIITNSNVTHVCKTFYTNGVWKLSSLFNYGNNDLNLSVFFCLCTLEIHIYIVLFNSQDSQQQQHTEQNNAAMELINSVVGVDEEGRSRQRILTFAAKRYHNHF